MINFDQFLQAMIDSNNGKLPLNSSQKNALLHDYHIPLWIIAGPGTGKTHTLSWLVLRRILIDGVSPDRIVLTTFTKKAAAELLQRIMSNLRLLEIAGITEAGSVDTTKILIGTLHSLCSRILQESRYEATFRIRVLEDELAQQFFIRKTKNQLLNLDDISFWKYFGFADPRDIYTPNKAKKVEFAAKLFNRITENMINCDEMKESGDPHLITLAFGYEEYRHSLSEHHRTDQAHLQHHFLEFLKTEAGESWLNEGLTVLVDEYQDTNPIQEAIYFKLAGKRIDLTVVGDDDQSLYRFRGATVESLIYFDDVCHSYTGVKPKTVYLNENRRSHPQIVDWVNRYIDNHPVMEDPVVRVRTPDKPHLQVPKEVKWDKYPAIHAIVKNTHILTADKVVEIIKELFDEDIILDYSQVALLTFSTQETPYGIKPYAEALKRENIPFYNPRNKRANRDQVFLGLIGAFSYILDPEFNRSLRLPNKVILYIEEARASYQEIIESGGFPTLEEYVTKSADTIRNVKIDGDRDFQFLRRPKGRPVTLSGLLYKLLGFEPYSSHLSDEASGERIKALNLVLTEFESMYNDGQLLIEKGPDGKGRIATPSLYNFYGVLVEGVHDGLNDPENEDVSIKPGMVNVMTIHQSKGLEFDVVFVLKPDKHAWVSDTHLLEDILGNYSARPLRFSTLRNREVRAQEDTVRMYFVAYSRAKHLLFLAGTNVNRWSIALPRVNGNYPDKKTQLNDLGVNIL